MLLKGKVPREKGFFWGLCRALDHRNLEPNSQCQIVCFFPMPEEKNFNLTNSTLSEKIEAVSVAKCIKTCSKHNIISFLTRKCLFTLLVLFRTVNIKTGTLCSGTLSKTERLFREEIGTEIGIK